MPIIPLDFRYRTAGKLVMYSDATRNSLARRVAIHSFRLLMGGMFIGTHVFAFFEPSLPVVKVSGGLLVIATPWKILNSDEMPKGRWCQNHSRPKS